MERPYLLCALLAAALLPQIAGVAQGASTPGADVAKVGPRRERFDAGSYQQVRYVSARGSDTAGDGSKDKPWRSLGKAIGAINDAEPQRKTALCVVDSSDRLPQR